MREQCAGGCVYRRLRNAWIVWECVQETKKSQRVTKMALQTNLKVQHQFQRPCWWASKLGLPSPERRLIQARSIRRRWTTSPGVEVSTLTRTECSSLKWSATDACHGSRHTRNTVCWPARTQGGHQGQVHVRVNQCSVPPHVHSLPGRVRRGDRMHPPWKNEWSPIGN